MMPMKDWPVHFKLGAIVGVLTLLVLFSQVIGALKILEPYAPASRGFARDLVAVAQASDLVQQQALSVSLLDLKVIAYDGQIQQLEAQIRMLEIRLAEAPGDDLLKSLKRKAERDLADLQELRKHTVCDKDRVFVPNTSCR